MEPPHSTSPAAGNASTTRIAAAAYEPLWAGWTARIALGAWIVICLITVIVGQLRSHASEPTVWELHRHDRLEIWARGLAVHTALDAALFAGLGLFAAWAVRRGGGLAAEGTRWLIAFAIALVPAVAMRAIEVHGPPAATQLLVPTVACLVGVWIGRMWLAGWRRRMWLAVQMLLLAGIAAGGAMVVGGMVTDAQPYDFDPVRVTPQEKRRLVDLVRRSRPHGTDPQPLEFSGADIDGLMAWGLSCNSPERKAMTRFDGEQGVARLTIAAPSAWGDGRFINIEVAGTMAARDGRLVFDVRRMQAGAVRVPPAMVELGLRRLVAGLRSQPDTDRVLRSIDTLQIEAGTLRITSVEGDRADGFVPSLLGLIARFDADPKLLDSTREQVRRLVAAAGGFPPDENARHEAFIRKAFERARDESYAADPIRQNRAAILALGIVLGHPAVEEYLGRVTDVSLRRRAQLSTGRVALRGRTDWTQHFWVSAALSLLANEEIAEAAGVLKEELDAEGKSGFSFADLMADRAGSLLAAAATRDRDSAKAVQAQLSTEFAVDDLFPRADGLPEGISAADLDAHYGGIDGPGYRELSGEIDRRLETCTLLQSATPAGD